MTIKNELDEMRLAKRISAKEVADGAGVSVNSVYAVLGRRITVSVIKQTTFSLVDEFIRNHDGNRKPLHNSYAHADLVDVVRKIRNGTIKQSQAARGFGMSPQYLSAICRGEKRKRVLSEVLGNQT